MKNVTIKSVLKISILILILSVGIDKLVYYSLNILSDNVLSGGGVGKQNHYLSAKDTIDIAVFGNSRASHHINPKLLSSKSFNIGVDGTSIAFSSTLIKLLPEKKKQIVIVSIDPSNFYNQDYDASDIKALRLKFHRNKIIYDEIKKAKQNDVLQLLYWSLDYNGKVLSMLKNYYKPKYNFKSFYGYNPIIVSETQKSIREIKFKKIKQKNCIELYDMSELYLKYFDDIQKFCETNNKQLIFVTTPTFKDFCKNDNNNLQKMMKDRNLLYWDYSDFYKDQESLDFWKDRTHLSKLGADKFSKALMEKVKINIKN